MDDIPAEFIQRQLNDSRYISKVVKGLLSNIVRTTDEEGNLVFSEDGEQIMIKDDLIPECNQALEELMGLEIEVNTFGLKIEDFGDNIECTAAEIEAITPFLE